MSSTVYLVLMVFPFMMCIGAVMDFLTMTIPNKISLIIIAAFAVAAASVGLPLEALAMHLGTGVMMLLVGMALFAVGGFGGGDAKLLAAASLWIGFDQLVPFLALTGIFGGVLAVAILFYRTAPIPLSDSPWAIMLHEKKTGIPYGIAITAGALTVYPETSLIKALAF